MNDSPKSLQKYIPYVPTESVMKHHNYDEYYILQPALYSSFLSQCLLETSTFGSKNYL